MRGLSLERPVRGLAKHRFLCRWGSALRWTVVSPLNARLWGAFLQARKQLKAWQPLSRSAQPNTSGNNVCAAAMSWTRLRNADR